MKDRKKKKVGTRHHQSLWAFVNLKNSAHSKIVAGAYNVCTSFGIS